MGLFEEVKKNVTVRQAAELYGFKPNRSGLIRCVFHKDNTPSMKVDRRYYCFGCGCTGDAVDFTAQLFGLGAREAAVKLVDDFGINYISKSRDSPVEKDDSIKTAEVIRTKKRDDWTRCVRAYLDYRLMLLDWKKQYAPKNPKEEWNERFVEALRELSYVEYVLDILLFGEKWDRDHLVQEKRKKVEEIERKCDDYVRRKPRECSVSDGINGSLEAVRNIKEQLAVTMNGTVKGTMQNYMTVLREDPILAGSLRFNLLNQRVDVVKILWWNDRVTSLTDEGEEFLFYYFERYYDLGNEKNMKKALRAEAHSNKYHPICDYLNELQWDGTERIRYVLKRYMGADESELVYECLKHFMIGEILRVFHPGYKMDEMLCLVGTQGAEKSTFFRFLAVKDDWFSDDLKHLNDEKVYGKLRRHWIMEMSEMIAAVSAKSNEEIKSFLVRQKDTFRIPYQQYEEDRLRQCVFAGTTNTKQFLPFDRSGARRFLPIMIHAGKAEKHILDDEAEARAYFDQLWAEAMYLYRTAENPAELMNFSREMESQISLYREQFMQEDTLAGTIQGWLDDYREDYVCIKMIWKEALDHQYGEPKRYESNEIAEIMDTKIVGWKRISSHRFRNYGTQKGWTRHVDDVNQNAKDGFRELTESEQQVLPF